MTSHRIPHDSVTTIAGPVGIIDSGGARTTRVVHVGGGKGDDPRRHNHVRDDIKRIVHIEFRGV